MSCSTSTFFDFVTLFCLLFSLITKFCVYLNVIVRHNKIDFRLKSILPLTKFVTNRRLIYVILASHWTMSAYKTNMERLILEKPNGT